MTETDSSNRMERLVGVCAWLMLFIGWTGVVKMILDLLVEHPNIDLQVITNILAGYALLRYSKGWRIYTLVVCWIYVITAAIGSVVVLVVVTFLHLDFPPLRVRMPTNMLEVLWGIVMIGIQITLLVILNNRKIKQFYLAQSDAGARMRLPARWLLYICCIIAAGVLSFGIGRYAEPKPMVNPPDQAPETLWVNGKMIPLEANPKILGGTLDVPVGKVQYATPIFTDRDGGKCRDIYTVTYGPNGLDQILLIQRDRSRYHSGGVKNTSDISGGSLKPYPGQGCREAEKDSLSVGKTVYPFSLLTGRGYHYADNMVTDYFLILFDGKDFGDEMNQPGFFEKLERDPSLFEGRLLKISYPLPEEP